MRRPAGTVPDYEPHRNPWQARVGYPARNTRAPGFHEESARRAESVWLPAPAAPVALRESALRSRCSPWRKGHLSYGHEYSCDRDPSFFIAMRGSTLVIRRLCAMEVHLGDGSAMSNIPPRGLRRGVGDSEQRMSARASSGRQPHRKPVRRGPDEWDGSATGVDASLLAAIRFTSTMSVLDRSPGQRGAPRAVRSSRRPRPRPNGEAVRPSDSAIDPH